MARFAYFCGNFPFRARQCTRAVFSLSPVDMKLPHIRINIYVFALLMVLPVLLLRDFTPDNELRYLNIADEAISGGHLFAFTNQGVPYADKPPLYLWIVMAGRALLGGHCMWFLSLASLLPAFGIVAVMSRWMRGELSLEGQNTARWLMLTSAYFIGSALVLRMDMLMCLFIVLALRTFYLWHAAGKNAPRRYAWLFPLYCFLALFTKGPVGLLVPLLVPVVWLVCRREWRCIGRYLGWRTWSVLLVLCGLWFAAVYADGGAEYLDNLLFHQTIDRAAKSFHHARPFWYYALSMWYVAAPWSLLTAGCAVAAVRRGWLRAPLQSYFAVVCVVTFVMLSSFSSKVDIYLLPALPFAAALCAIWAARLPRRTRWAAALLAVVPALPFALAAPAAAFCSARVAGAEAFATPLVLVAAALLSVAGLVAFWLLFKRHDVLGTVRLLSAGLLAAVFVAAWDLPRLNPYIGYGAVCAEAGQTADAYRAAEIRTYNVRRAENMSVYLGRPVRQMDAAALSAPDSVRSVLIVRTKDWRRDSVLRCVPGLRAESECGPYTLCVKGQ